MLAVGIRLWCNKRMRAPSDNPIKKPEEDLLLRTGVANNLVSEIRDLDASEGFVMAVMGPWGSGKTSLINLVRLGLDDEPKILHIDFNPWMFSGTEQLVSIFFTELAVQLKIKDGKKFAKIAGEIEAYGELLNPLLNSLALIPFVGGWFERLSKAAGAFRKFAERKKKSVTAQRAELAKNLAELEQPIVVVIDDIDRLQTNEIRDIFKLVRLTASFPNIIYLLAFDRARVEDALTESGIDGRSYLEKIVQVSVDIPAVSDGILLTQLGKALEQGLDGVDGGANLDQDRWPDLLMEVIKPLVKNMRDVRRYTASARGTVRALGGKVELGDILALEAVRVFLPDVFLQLTQAQEALTNIRDYNDRYEPPRLKQSIEHILEVTGDKNEETVKALFKRVFPAADRHIGGSSYSYDFSGHWLKDRRLAHKDILGLYMERVASADLTAFDEAEKAYAILADQKELDKFLRSVDKGVLQDVVEALTSYDRTYPAEAVVPASVVLLNLVPDIPERPKDIWTFTDARITVTRVVLRLLRQLEKPEPIEEAVIKIMPQVTTLSSKLELVRLIGYKEGSGHKLVSEDASKRLENELNAEVRAAGTRKLASEWDLMRLLLAVERSDSTGDPVTLSATSPALNANILKGASYVAQSQTMGDRAVKKETRLAWDVLIEVLGDEDRVRSAVKAARKLEQDDKKLKEVIELTEKYLGGWRPKED